MSERKRVQIEELLDIIKYNKNWNGINKQLATIILHQLQAGRKQEGNMNVPHRLSDEELELLKQEYVYYWDDGDRYFASFEKDVNDIRALLNLPPQHNNWFF